MSESKINLPEFPTIQQWVDEAKKQNKTLILLVAGDSASGKSSRASLFGFKRIITSTTRPKRKYEENEKDYEFLSEADFLKQKAAGQFLETTKYGFQMYGTKLSQFQLQMNKKEPCYLILDTHGITSVKNELEIHYANDFLVKTIYYEINKDVFMKRIKNRGDSVSEEYFDRRWQENEFAHKILKNNSKLVDLIIDANQEIKELDPTFSTKK